MAPVQDKGLCHISERPRLMVAFGVKEISGAIRYARGAGQVRFAPTRKPQLVRRRLKRASPVSQRGEGAKNFSVLSIYYCASSPFHELFLGYVCGPVVK